MEFWIDSISTDAIKQVSKLGILYGVTTNPALLHNDRELNDIINEFKEGPIAVQVSANSAEEMVEQGVILSELCDRIIVKVPVTKEGLEAIHHLAERHIITMATCVFTPLQALLAAEAGSDYVALYLSRFERSGGNIKELVSACKKILENYHWDTRLIAASIQDIKQIELCAEAGVHAITLKEPLFKQLLVDNPLTLEALEDFDTFSKAKDASLYRPRTLT